MNGWLLDTNVISELRKPNCDNRVKTWSERHGATAYFLSRVTLAEIRYGIELVLENTPFRLELEHWLEQRVRPWFADRILDIDEQVILTWRRMVELGRRQNYTFSQPDLFIAATASVHGLCVVTRNVDDFLRARVPVLNPWTDESPRNT
jgi:predicted nucleic acid-binding protein